MASTVGAATGPYAAILNIAQMLVAGGSMEATLQRIVTAVGQAMFAESASLGSYRRDEDAYVHEAGWSEIGLSREEIADVGHVYPLAENPELRKQLQARGVTERHVDDAELSSEWQAYFASWNLKTTLDCPLVFAGTVVGLLAVEESRFVRRYTPTERALFQQLCGLAAIGIHAARQERELVETRRELDKVRRALDAAR